VFAPVYLSKRRWSDRVKQLELPLFPGYVFCRFRSDQRLTVLTTPGIASIVGFGSVPAPVSDEEIASVRAITQSGLPYGPWPYVRIGDCVRIDTGCMRGMRGTLVRLRDDFRVVVNVELLQRSVAVEIDRELIALDTPAMRHSA
jgi:transcription antitermination factor NusG